MIAGSGVAIRKLLSVMSSEGYDFHSWCLHKADSSQRKWRVEKVPIDITPAHGFNLRAQIVGESGRNVKWIQQETNCRVQIKGRGSGFLERDTNLESDEDMYLSITYVLIICKSLSHPLTCVGALTTT